MATILKVSHPLFLCLIIFCASHFVLINSTEFEVGGKDGWVVPKSKDNDEIYNQWASQNRFKVGDTINFKYEKDSVLVVTEEEYEKCKVSRPLFFSNNGDTVFKFERPGLFFFISGVQGHCPRGQKMIIKVLDVENIPAIAAAPAAPSPQVANENAKSKATHQITPIATSTLILLSLIFAMLFV